MNNGILNAELALAVRKCLPFVRRHAIISGGDGSVTYAFAVRALADYDARRVQEEAVKNIVTAEQQRRGWRDLFERFAVRGSVAYKITMPTDEALRADISGTDAFTQAARAVRPGEGYLPAAPPAKNCTCDTCTQYRRSSLNFYKD